MSKTPACLFGAGVLGHTWITTRVANEPGVYHAEAIYCQASFGADAVRALDELTVNQAARGPAGYIYERVITRRVKRTWVRRSRAYALLDQPTDGRLPYEPDMEEPA